MKKDFESSEQTVGQAHTRTLTLDGDAELSENVIEPAGTLMVDTSHADMLKFMEEPVEVLVYPSTNQQAENPIELGVNGRRQFIFRNEPLVVKRKYVEVLARAKQTAYTQRGEVVADVNTYDSHTALRYPFRVVRDDNPRGFDWLRQVLAEG